MKDITIEIKKLGAIRDSSLTLSPLMIFSGESGLGKSYVAILSHYIFHLLLSKTRLNSFFEERSISFEEQKNAFKNEGIALTLQKSELEEWLSRDAVDYLRYMLNYPTLEAQISITLPTSLSDNLVYHFKEGIKGLVGKDDVYIELTLNELTYSVSYGGTFSESPYSYLLRYVLIQEIFGSFRDLEDNYIFPPSRGPMLTENLTPQTGLYKEFYRTLIDLRSVSERKPSIEESTKELFSKILDGVISYENGEYIYSTEGKEIPLSASAASIRELASLALMATQRDISKAAILVEEPEAHLHPLKQRMMADIVAGLHKGGAHLQITTHSDYFLSRLNELINYKKLLNKLGIEDKIQEEWPAEVKDLDVLPELALGTEGISAYLLVRRDDQSVELQKQDLKEVGVPFSSFSKAIDDSFKTRNEIANLLEDDDMF